MKQLYNRAQMSEITGYKNPIYVLENYNDFSVTQYKVLLNSSGKYFLKCGKSMFNGKTKLVYFADQKKTLMELLPILRAEELFSIIKNILQTLIYTENNGLLNCKNIELDSNRIYINQESMTAELVYLPLNVKGDVRAVFENELSAFLVTVFSKALQLPEQVSETICTGLLNRHSSIDEIMCVINGELNNSDKGDNDEHITASVKEKTPQMLQLSCKDFMTKCVFKITENEFVIGKNEELVDGYIGFNSAVSRIHCKIVRMDGDFYVIDMKSSNGTFVNGDRIEPQKAYRISNSDTIRLANSDFKVKIK